MAPPMVIGLMCEMRNESSLPGVGTPVNHIIYGFCNTPELYFSKKTICNLPQRVPDTYVIHLCMQMMFEMIYTFVDNVCGQTLDRNTKHIPNRRLEYTTNLFLMS